MLMNPFDKISSMKFSVHVCYERHIIHKTHTYTHIDKTKWKRKLKKFKKKNHKLIEKKSKNTQN